MGRQLPSTVSETPDGSWAEWRWDGESLTIRTDRYGFMPLFYWHGEDAFALSTSMIELLNRGAPADIDPVAIAIFLHLGYYLDDTTAFRRIRTPPPNGLIRWNGELEIQDRRPAWREEPRTFPQLVEGFIDLFRASIDRRKPNDDRFAVPLSGGLDSRHILLELLAQGHRPAFAITSRFPPPRPSPDVEPATRLAQAVGVRHVVVDPPPLFESERRQNLLQHLCTDENGWILALADHLRRKSIHTSYDGIGGDLWGPRLFNAERMALYRAERFDELAEILLGRDASPLAAMLGREYAGVDDRDAAVHAIARELARYRDLPDPSIGFLMFNRKRREISHSASCILATLGVVHNPFVDHELFDFLASAPQATVWSGPLHEEVMRTPAAHSLCREAQSPLARRVASTGPSARPRCALSRAPRDAPLDHAAPPSASGHA